MPFIVLEGPDGSGTTTHAKLLSEALSKQGRDVLLTAEPTDGPIGVCIRKQLKEKSIPSAAAIQLAFTADRAWHVEAVIAPALKAGTVVICDRYATSTLVYGSVLGLDSQWLRRINEPFPKPDLEIFALPLLEVSLRRMQSRTSKDVFENKEFQEKVYDMYKRLAADNKTIRIFDTSQTKEKVHSAALRLLLSMLK